MNWIPMVQHGVYFTSHKHGNSLLRLQNAEKLLITWARVVSQNNMVMSYTRPGTKDDCAGEPTNNSPNQSTDYLSDH